MRSQLPLFAMPAYYVRFPAPVPVGEVRVRADWLKACWPGVAEWVNKGCVAGGNGWVTWRITRSGVALAGRKGRDAAGMVGREWTGSRVEEI